MIVTRQALSQFIPGDAKARSRWARMHASSQKFYLVRFRLLNAAAPAELVNIAANTTTKACPLVIDANTNEYGKTGTFVPKCVVIAGAHKRTETLNAGRHHSIGWVGEQALKAMNICASDGISSDELQQKLQEAISLKFNKSPEGSSTYGPYDGMGGWIRQVFPFENYVIFSLKGDTFRLDYEFDATTREVKLVGTPVKVEQEYVDVASAGVGYESFVSRSKAPYIPLGVRTNSDMVLPSLFTVSLGAENSELRNPMFGEAFLNVDKVVAAYLANIKNGYHSPILPPGAPVPNVRMLFAKELRCRGVRTPADFFVWAERNKSKSLAAAGPTDASDYAHVGDPGDKSTWKLPIHDKAHVRKAMSGFYDAKIPAKAQPKAAKKIVDRAKGMGVDTGNFETINTDLLAGGPGSGRHAEGGPVTAKNLNHKDAKFQQAARDYASSKGASVSSSTTTTDDARAKNPISYPSRHELTVEHNGKKYTASGNSHQEVFDKLDNMGVGKMEAGGPGSGPRPKGESYGDDTGEGGYNTGKTVLPARDQVIAELTKQGFEPDMANTTYNAADHKPKFFSKINNRGKHSRTTHTVMVNPDGSFEHTAEMSHSGNSFKDAQGLKDVFKAAGTLIQTGKGVLALQRILNASDALQSAENSAVQAAAKARANVTAKAMHAHLVSKGFAKTGTKKSEDGTPIRMYTHPALGHKAAVSANGVFSVKAPGKNVRPTSGKTISALQKCC